MELMIVPVTFGIWTTLFCSIFLIQCSFRKKKKEIQIPPPQPPVLETASPHNVQRHTSSVNSTTPLSSGVGIMFPNKKNPIEFAEMTQSTQSIQETPPKKIGQASIKHATEKKNNKSKSSNKKKKSRSKMKKLENRETTSIIKTAQLPTKRSNIKSKGVQLVVERTQEDSLLSPSLIAVRKWEKEMRKEFPEISERTQPAESSVKRIELTEPLFSDPLVSPSQFSSKENFENDQGHEQLSLSNHPTSISKTNNDKTTTQSIRYISHQQEVSPPPPPLTTTAATTTTTEAKKPDEDDCPTARLFTPEWKITHT